MTSLADALKAMEQKDFPKACEILDALAPADDAERASVLFYRAWCGETSGDVDIEGLVSRYEEAASLARDPLLEANASFRAGWVQMQSGNQHRADAAYARAADRLAAAGLKNELYCHAAFWQAVGWERAGRYLDAAERYREVAGLDNNLRPECDYRRIQCLVLVGALEDALTACEEADASLDEHSHPRAAEIREQIARERASLRAAIDSA